MNVASGVRRGLIAGALSVCWLASAYAAPQSDENFPRDVLKGIEAMRRLPVEGFQLVQSQGRLLIVSTNGHFAVVEGRILDLWNNVEVHSVSDVDKTTHIPLARLGIEAKALGGVTWGRADSSATTTVFLDPGSPESRKLLPVLKSVADRNRIDVVFVPARNARAPISRALICDHGAALAFLKEAREPVAISDRDACGVKELERARVTLTLLGITGLPFSVAPNGATIVGTPANYAEFIAENGGSK